MEAKNIISDELLAAYFDKNTLPIENLCVNKAIEDSAELQEVSQIYSDIIDCCEELDLSELKSHKLL